jgi:hypothetical protein
MMAIGTLGTLDQHHYVWALFFAISAVLAWTLLRRWRMLDRRTRRPTIRRLGRFAWRRITPTALAALCEQRIGVRVDAAAPVTLPGQPPVSTVIALAGDALWVLDDESSPTRPRIGRALARWARRGVVAHVESSRRGEMVELSWPTHGAFVRGLIKPGPLADAFAGQLLADELARGD